MSKATNSNNFSQRLAGWVARGAQRYADGQAEKQNAGAPTQAFPAVRPQQAQFTPDGQMVSYGYAPMSHSHQPGQHPAHGYSQTWWCAGDNGGHYQSFGAPPQGMYGGAYGVPQRAPNQHDGWSSPAQQEPVKLTLGQKFGRGVAQAALWLGGATAAAGIGSSMWAVVTQPEVVTSQEVKEATAGDRNATLEWVARVVDENQAGAEKLNEAQEEKGGTDRAFYRLAADALNEAEQAKDNANDARNIATGTAMTGVGGGVMLFGRKISPTTKNE